MTKILHLSSNNRTTPINRTHVYEHVRSKLHIDICNLNLFKLQLLFNPLQLLAPSPSLQRVIIKKSPETTKSQHFTPIKQHISRRILPTTLKSSQLLLWKFSHFLIIKFVPIFIVFRFEICRRKFGWTWNWCGI